MVNLNNLFMWMKINCFVWWFSEDKTCKGLVLSINVVKILEGDNVCQHSSSFHSLAEQVLLQVIWYKAASCFCIGNIKKLCLVWENAVWVLLFFFNLGVCGLFGIKAV